MFMLTGGEPDALIDEYKEFEEIFPAFKKWCSDAKTIDVIACGFGEYESTKTIKATNIDPESNDFNKKYSKFTDKVSKNVGDKLHIGKQLKWGENKDWFYIGSSNEMESLWHKTH